MSPDGNFVEVVEIPDHPWFVAVQCHPEFRSKPTAAHPLFRGFIRAALDAREQKNADVPSEKRPHLKGTAVTAGV